MLARWIRCSSASRRYPRRPVRAHGRARGRDRTHDRRRGRERPVVLPTASLPAGWSDETESLKATTAAVLAVDLARHVGITLALLQDVPGGWDVSMGNVVLAEGGPTCITDGLMAVVEPGEFACETCGARARYGG